MPLYITVSVFLKRMGITSVLQLQSILKEYIVGETLPKSSDLCTFVKISQAALLWQSDLNLPPPHRQKLSLCDSLVQCISHIYSECTNVSQFAKQSIKEIPPSPRNNNSKKSFQRKDSLCFHQLGENEV